MSSLLRATPALRPVARVATTVTRCCCGATLDRNSANVRAASTAAAKAEEHVPPPQSQPSASLKPLSKMDLSPQEQEILESAIRVNQAGELAATLIYLAQTPVVLRSRPDLSPLMSHMYEQEAGHLTTFNSLAATHRVRPTAMEPLWRAAASFLGWSTAMVSTRAAMACTEAVETVIGEHYNGQLEKLLEMIRQREAKGEPVEDDLLELVGTIRRIRDEELEHLDHAVDHGAKEAEAYPVLTEIVKRGCRGAIWVSERV